MDSLHVDTKSPISSLYQDIQNKFQDSFQEKREGSDIVNEIQTLTHTLSEEAITEEERLEANIRLATCYREMFSFKESMKFLNKALKIAKDLYGPIAAETANVYRRQRDLLVEQFKWKDASKCQEVIIQIESALLGEGGEIASLIREWDELGEIYRRVGEFDFAQQAYERGLEMIEQPEGSLYLRLKQHLAHLHYYKGDYQVAIDLFTEIATLNEQTPQHERDFSLDYELYHTLGNAYLYEGEHKKAEESYLHALKISESEAQKASMYYSLGVLHQTLKNHIKAKRYTKESIRIYDPLLEQFAHLPADTITYDQVTVMSKAAKAYLTLGSIFFQTEEDDEAEKMFMKALDLNHRSSQENNNADMAYIYDHLGRLADRKGERGEAHSFFRKALVLAQQISSAKNYQLASIYMHLGVHHLEGKQIQDAVYHLEQSFETYKRCYPGATCVDMADVLGYLAKCWESIDNWKNCKLCAEEARNIYVHHSSNMFDDKIDEMIQLRRKAHRQLYQQRHMDSVKKERSQDFSKEERARLGMKYAHDSKRDLYSKAHEALIDKRRKAKDPSYLSYTERDQLEKRDENLEKLKERSSQVKVQKLMSRSEIVNKKKKVKMSA